MSIYCHTVSCELVEVHLDVFSIKTGSPFNTVIGCLARRKYFISKKVLECYKKHFLKGTTPKTSNKAFVANRFSEWFSTIVSSLKQKVMPLKNFVWGTAANKTNKQTDKTFPFQYVSVVFVRNQLKN